MDDYEEAARRAWLEWLRYNDQQLDVMARRLDWFENRVFNPPRLNWEELLAEQRVLTDVKSQVEVIHGIASDALPAIRRQDDRRETQVFVDRCGAMRERISELSVEFVRLIGEVGRAHDRRPLDVKRDAPGAHGVYR